MTDPSATIPPIAGSSETNADLPATQFPRLQRITATDLVGPTAANRQHASLEKRTETLLSALNQLIDISNALDTWFLRRNGTSQKDAIAGVTGDIPMNNKTLAGLRAAAANGEAVRYEEFLALASLVGGVSSTPPGMVAGFGGATPPAGWLVADGALYTTSGYIKDDGILVAYPPSSPGSLSWAALTNLRTHLGSAWGGDAITSFRIPDYRGRAVIGAGIGKNGQVVEVTITNAGSGFTAAPSVAFAPPAGGGTTATANAVVEDGKVVAIRITNPGSGYWSAPVVTISGSGGTGAAAIAKIALTSRPLGSYGGEELHTMTSDELAKGKHTHNIGTSWDGYDRNWVRFGNGGDVPSVGGGPVKDSVINANNPTPFNIMQPWATATVCIKY